MPPFDNGFCVADFAQVQKMRPEAQARPTRSPRIGYGQSTVHARVPPICPSVRFLHPESPIPSHAMVKEKGAGYNLQMNRLQEVKKVGWFEHIDV